MQHFVTLLLLITCNVFGQHHKEAITNLFVFNKGIYTSFTELLTNSPKYLNCQFEIVRPLAGYPSYYYYDSLNKQHVFEDSLFAIVQEGTLFLYFKEVFYKRSLAGAITILMRTNWHSAFQRHYDIFEDNICILDFETGKVGLLKFKLIDLIIQRDPLLHKDFLSMENKGDKNNLLRYIIKYNERNPFYLK